MAEFSILINIAVALMIAFIGGIIVRRFGLPTFIGYLLAGIVIGPFTPGFVGDTGTLNQLADLGLVFLMFGVGLNFTFQDLWRVRTIAVPGALIQTAIITLAAFGLGRMWGWTPAAGLLLGLALSICSTVVMLRLLMDHGLLHSGAGQAAIGWSIFEDLITILVVVFLPTLANGIAAFDWTVLGMTLLKAALFIVVVIFVGTRLFPWLLMRIVNLRSRELWFLALLVISLGTALGAAEIFGVSLALGAFAAGVVISASPLSRQVEADMLPFREIFAVLFFVSIGMVANPQYLVTNLRPVLVFSALVIFGKPLIVTILGLILPWPARTSLVVAASRSQISEFSFVLGQAGVLLGILTTNQYTLILAVALISITLNPFFFRLSEVMEKVLRRHPRIWRIFDRHGEDHDAIPLPGASSAGHVVIVGYGRVGHQIASLLRDMSIPYLIVHDDPDEVDALEKQGVPNLFGDAANSDVVLFAGLEKARALVVAGPDQAASEMVVATARNLAPNLPIIARAGSREGVARLTKLGAKYVIQPELEGGLEIVRHTLLQLGYPVNEITRYTDTVRQDQYDLQVNTEAEHRLLRNLIDAAQGIEVTWYSITDKAPVVGQTLLDANLRARTGASVVAILRGNQLIANPKSMTVFQPGDRIGFIGDEIQIRAVEDMIATADEPPL